MLTRCLFWRDVAVRLSFSNFFCDWPSVDHWRPERSLRLLSNVHFCGVVDNKNGWTAQTAEFVDNRFTPRYLSSFASCYKSHRLPTCLRPVHYVVLIHDFNVSFKILPLLSRISFGCRPMTWWYFDSIHSKTVFAMQASARPLIDANDLR